MAVLCDEFLGFQPLWFSHHDTAKKKKKKKKKKRKEGKRKKKNKWEGGANIKLVTNSIFIETFTKS